MDLEDDRFDVTYDPAHVAVEALLEVIRKLEYEPTVVESKSAAQESAASQVDVSALPADLSKLFAEARRTKKPVLLRFSGPG